MDHQLHRHKLAVLVFLVLVSMSCGRLSRALSPTDPSTPLSPLPLPDTPDQAPEGAISRGPGDYDFTLEHGGLTRQYLVHVPPGYSMTAVPMVIVFHGGGGNAETAQEGIGGMNAKSDREGFIAVYPLGSESVDRLQGEGRYFWNAGGGIVIDFIDYSVDDVGFISSMLDALERDFAIDPKRIYATGISNGAWMSYALACRLSQRIAAVAPVAGGLVTENCHPSTPVSIMHFHGKQDPGWPYYGGGSCWTDSYRPPIMDTISSWIERNECEQSPTITYQNENATCETYSCSQDTGVTFCSIEDGGHTYPGGETSLLLNLVPWDDDCALGRGRGAGRVSQSISAMDEMWAFFLSHPKK